MSRELQLKIGRLTDNGAFGQHPEGMSPVDIRGRKFQEEGLAGASTLERVYANCDGGTVGISVWLEQAKKSLWGGSQRGDWGWIDTIEPGSHDENSPTYQNLYWASNL